MYDGTGNYVVTFLVAGVLFLASCLFLVAVVVLKRRQDTNLTLKLSNSSHNDDPIEEHA